MTREISGFRRVVNETRSLLGCYAACSILLPKFRYNLLFQNAYNPRRIQILNPYCLLWFIIITNFKTFIKNYAKIKEIEMVYQY